jgi:hypothetical protein
MPGIETVLFLVELGPVVAAFAGRLRVPATLYLPVSQSAAECSRSRLEVPAVR